MSNYAVYRVFKKYGKKPRLLIENLTRKQAMTIVQNTPSESESMVVFDKNK